MMPRIRAEMIMMINYLYSGIVKNDTGMQVLLVFNYIQWVKSNICVSVLVSLSRRTVWDFEQRLYRMLGAHCHE